MATPRRTPAPELDRVPQGPGRRSKAPAKVPPTTRIAPERRTPAGTPSPSGGRDWAVLDQRYQMRGNISLLVDRETLASWRARPGRGRPFPQGLIDLAGQIGVMLRLPLRQQEGHLRGLCALLGVEIDVPDHSTLCRRRRGSAFRPYQPSKQELDEGVVIAVDSSGIRVSTLSTWRHLRFGSLQSRSWVKLHLAAATGSGGILAASVTDQDGPGSGDCSQGPGLVERAGAALPPGGLTGVLADGAYDTRQMYEAVASATGRAGRYVCPPGIDAVYGLHPDRDVALAQIGRIGMRRWREYTGYGQRAQGEVAFGAHKSIFTEGVRARTLRGARAEILAALSLYNLWREREVALGI